MKFKIAILFIIILLVALFSWQFFKLKNDEQQQESLIQSPNPASEQITEKQFEDSQPEKNIIPETASKSVVLEVPFASQAPTGKWSDSHFGDGCEEASLILAMAWVNGENITPQSMEQKMLELEKFEVNLFGHFIDTSAQDTARLISEYFNYENYEVSTNVTATDIREELQKGNLVLANFNGQRLNNPNYTPPGPVTHMMVIKGYDVNSGEFLTNDVGTRRGESYRYSEDVLQSALQNYPTASRHMPQTPGDTAMIVIRK